MTYKYDRTAASGDARLHNEILSLIVDLKSELREAEYTGVPVEVLQQVKDHLQKAMDVFKAANRR
jgi:hypothetical protein